MEEPAEQRCRRQRVGPAEVTADDGGDCEALLRGAGEGGFHQITHLAAVQERQRRPGCAGLGRPLPPRPHHPRERRAEPAAKLRVEERVREQVREGVGRQT